MNANKFDCFIHWNPWSIVVDFSHGHRRRRAVGFRLCLTQEDGGREGPFVTNQPEPVTGPWVYTEAVYLFLKLSVVWEVSSTLLTILFLADTGRHKYDEATGWTATSTPWFCQTKPVAVLHANWQFWWSLSANPLPLHCQRFVLRPALPGGHDNLRLLKCF